MRRSVPGSDFCIDIFVPFIFGQMIYFKYLFLCINAKFIEIFFNCFFLYLHLLWRFFVSLSVERVHYSGLSNTSFLTASELFVLIKQFCKWERWTVVLCSKNKCLRKIKETFVPLSVLTLFSKNTYYLEDSSISPQLPVKPVLLVWLYFSCRAFCLSLQVVLTSKFLLVAEFKLVFQINFLSPTKRFKNFDLNGNIIEIQRVMQLACSL